MKANPYLVCDRCGCVEHDLKKFAQWHGTCAGIFRLYVPEHFYVTTIVA